MRARTLAFVAAAALAMAGPAALAAQSRVRTIIVDNLAFGPAPKDLKVGDTLQWVNHDLFLHSATAQDHSFDVELKPGGTGKVVLKHAGDIAYICRYHPGMKGVLHIRP